MEEMNDSGMEEYYNHIKECQKYAGAVSTEEKYTVASMVGMVTCGGCSQTERYIDTISEVFDLNRLWKCVISYPDLVKCFLKNGADKNVGLALLKETHTKDVAGQIYDMLE